MSVNLGSDKITVFVRNVLGCGCPDEVFNKIEVSDIDLTPEISTTTRIVVGDTLLIYILPVTPAEIVAEHIGKLVVAGRQDRDSHGYNRFRLVLRSCDNRAIEEVISASFLVVAGADEKLYLHFVESDALSGLGVE